MTIERMVSPVGRRKLRALDSANRVVVGMVLNFQHNGAKVKQEI
jgi:hypothetical protein